MALDHALLDILLEQAVDRVVDLAARRAAVAVGGEVFEDPALPARQREGLAGNLRIAPVGMHEQLPELERRAHRRLAAANGSDPGQNLLDVNRLANHIVGARLEQPENLRQRVLFENRNDRKFRILPD